MKKLFFLFLVQFSLVNLFAQGVNLAWVKNMGGNADYAFGRAVATDKLGNVYTTGYFRDTTDFDPGSGTSIINHQGGDDMYVQKLDAAGNFIWVAGFTALGNQEGNSIAIDDTGNVYVACQFDGTVDFDPGAGVFNLSSTISSVAICKLDAQKNFKWAKVLGGGDGNCVPQGLTLDKTNGNIYITGWFTSTADFDPGAAIANLSTTSQSDIDAFVVKLNAQGNYIWAKRLGGTSLDAARSVAVDKLGNVYTTGSFTGTADFDPGNGTYNLVSSNSYWNIYVNKLDASGNFVWAKTIGSSNTADESGASIALDTAGNVIYTGKFYGTLDFNPAAGVFNMTSAGSEDMFISKLDGAGNFIWAIRIGGQYGDATTEIVTDVAGNIYATGAFTRTVDFDPGVGTYNLGSSTASYIFVSKLDVGGNFVWARRMGNGYSCQSYGIALDSTGGIYTCGGFSTQADFDPDGAGYLLSSHGNWDAFTLKMQACTATTSTITTSACVSYTSPSGNYTYTSSGTYTDTIPNAAGCDSVITINLTIGGGSSVAPLKQWDKRFGGSGPESIKQIVSTHDGGYIAGGSSTSGISGDVTEVSRSSGANDYWVVKTDSNGTKVWDHRYGGSAGDELQSIVPTADKGYILAGNSSSPISGEKSQATSGASDYWIIKIDSNGVKQWDKTYGGNNIDILLSIKAANDGGYILAGYSNSPVSGDKTQASRGIDDYWVIKINSSGIKQWDATFGGSSSDLLTAIETTNDNGYILGGRSSSGISGDKTQATKGVNDYWIVKIDSNGVKQWDADFGGTSADDLTTILQTTDSGFLVAGYSRSSISGDKTHANKDATLATTDFWIVKINSSGVKQYDFVFGGQGEDQLTSALETTDGGYLWCGSSESPVSGDKTQPSQGVYDYWMIKSNSTGVKQWDSRYGGSDVDIANCSIKATSGGYILGGFSASPVSGDKTQGTQGGNDFWIVKTYPEISSITTGTINASICQGESYFFNGLNRTTAGAYLDTLVNASGCDSILTLNLTVKQTSTGTIIASICQGESYLFNGANRTTTGAYLDTLVNAVGCDSILTLNLTVKQISTGSVSASICQGESYFFNGANRTTTGAYLDTLVNAVGCDSILTLNLTVNDLPAAAINGPATICSGLSATLTASGGTGYSWDNGLGTNAQVTVTPTNTTTYTVTVTDANTCSATAQQTVSVTSTPTASITGPTQICNGESATLTANGGNTYNWANGLGTNATITPSPTGTTTYTVTATIGANCSATASQTVTVYQPAASQFSQTICAGQSYTYNGIALTTAGAYSDTLQTVNGCDSIVTLSLSINPSPDATITPNGTVAICQNDSIELSAPAGNPTYLWSTNATTQSIFVKFGGNYSVTVTNINNCSAASSPVALTVNNLPAIPIITRANDTLTATTADNYQWYFNNGAINQANNQTLTITENGNYYVEIMDANGCKNRSAVYNATSVDLQNIVEEFGVKLYPNPNTGSFVIAFSDDVTREVEITDAIGRVILSSIRVEKQKQIALNETAAGIYFLHIKQNGQLKSLKFSLIR